VHDGALAFLVVVSKGVATENGAELSENAKINAKYDQIAPEILVNQRKCPFKEDTDQEE
jgi:hypothetical protein